MQQRGTSNLKPAPVSQGGINRMSARPRLVYENLVCALGEGAASLNLSPSGLGPPAPDLPAPAGSAQLEIPRRPRSPPPCPGPARPPGPETRSRSGPGYATREAPERRPRLPPTPGSAPLASGRRRLLYLHSVTLTTSVCAWAGGLRVTARVRVGRPAP